MHHAGRGASRWTNQRHPRLQRLTRMAPVQHAHTQPVAGRAHLIHQHARGTVVVEDDHVHAAVVVQIPRGHAPPHLKLRKGRPRGIGDVDEPPTAIVPEQVAPLLERIGVSAPRLRGEVPHGAVHHDHVQPAVVVVVQQARTESGEAQAEQPRFHRPILEEPLLDLPIEDIAFVVEVGDEEVLVAVAVDVAGVDPHAALRLPGPVHGHARKQRLVREPARPALVDPQMVGIAVVGHVEIGPLVPVHVRGQHPQAAPGEPREPGSSRHVRERAVAVVVQQPGGHRIVDGRVAVVARRAC